MPFSKKNIVSLKEKIDFLYSFEILYYMLHRFGYCWIILIKKPEIIARRGKYIQQIRDCRTENRSIFYINEIRLIILLMFCK